MSARGRAQRRYGLPLAIACLVLAALSAAPVAEAQPRDPFLTWHTIHTEHFDVHYYEPLGLVARRTAAIAERASASLDLVFGSHPSVRVQLVVTDESDSANGSATALPYDVIRVFAEPPEDLSPLGDFDDWLTVLVTHEHTHVHHLDQATGIAAIVNLLLGRIYMPNHVLPRWMLEGIAVWQESELTSAGRLRSTLWDMWLRADFLEDRVWDLDQISSGADRWPHGHAWYLYGGFFMRFIADRYGREAIATIAHEYADVILPYGINRVAQRATGFTFLELWEQFVAERRAHYTAQRDAVDALGRHEGTRLTHHGEMARAPRFLPDGRLAYVRSDNRSRPRIVTVDLASGDVDDTLVRMNSEGQFAVHPDGGSVFFSRVDADRDIYFFGDLFRRDLASGEETRLSSGDRAREPDVSPDGRSIVFTTTQAGTTRLMIASTTDVEGTRRELVPTDDFELAYTPRFSPDGRRVVYARWSHGGYRDLVLVDVATGRTQALTHDRAQESGPCWSPDGRAIYFASDRTGISNIYAYHLASGAIRQITNTTLGAYQPAISPDGARMAYVGYTSLGFDLFAMDVDPDGFRAAPTYVDTRPPPSDHETLVTALSEDYDPLPTLGPRSYLVDLAQDAFGPQLGLSTQGEDAATFHTYSARVGVGLVRGNPVLDLSYGFSRLPIGLGVRAFYREQQGGGLTVAGEDRGWIQGAAGGDVGIGYSFPRAFRSDSVSLSYAFTYTWPIEPFFTQGELDPNTPPPTLPLTGRFGTLRLGWSYSDVERYGYDISSSNGRSINVGLSLSDPVLGSQYRVVTATWSITQYIPMPWGEHHVLALRYAGGISGGDLDRRGVFGIGGFPETALIEGLYNPVVLGGAALRGYAPNGRVGTQMHMLQAEFRFPVFRFNRGLFTLPLYLNRVHAKVFCDVGDAFFGDLDPSRLRVGVGAELMIDFTLFYVLGFTLRVGYARGLMEGGLDQVYGHLGVPF